MVNRLVNKTLTKTCLHKIQVTKTNKIENECIAQLAEQWTFNP